MATLQAQQHKLRTRITILSTAQRHGWIQVVAQDMVAFDRLVFVHNNHHRVEVYLTKGAGYVREFAVCRRHHTGQRWNFERGVYRQERYKLEKLLETFGGVA